MHRDPATTPALMNLVECFWAMERTNRAAACTESVKPVTHTCMLANALPDDHRARAILMRRLIPRRLYPGRDRVGAQLTTLQ